YASDINVRLPDRIFASNSSLRQHARGFTLLEMITVISLLVLLMVGAVAAYDSLREDSFQQLAKTEMTTIIKALKQYRQDVGRFPAQLHPADFTSLRYPLVLDGSDYRGLEPSERWN